MKNFVKVSVLGFILLFVITFPFPLLTFENPTFWLESFFSRIEQNIVTLFTSKIHFQNHFYSDSADILIHSTFLIFFALIISILLRPFYKKLNIDFLLINTSSFILAFFLVKYGFDKVFKIQFPYPEPNILATPFGNLDKDILYWSTVGKSYSYSFFCGIIEIIPGVLLLFNKTRKFAALISFGVLIHILLINISFEIEVKLLTTFLLFLSLIILYFYRKEIICSLITNKPCENRELKPPYIHPKLKQLTKYCVIFFIFFESTFNAFSTGNFNDDKVEKSLIHGEYKILESAKDLNNLFQLKSNTLESIFIHRKNYLILKSKKNSFASFSFIGNLTSTTIFIKTHKIRIDFTKTSNSNYTIIFTNNKDTLSLKTQRIRY